MHSGKWIRFTAVLVTCLATCVVASAQYGGGMGGGTGTPGMPGTPNSKGYSYGNGKAIGIGVGAAAGAAVGIALLVRHHHRAVAAANAQKSQQASLTGCTQSILEGVSLRNESDNLTYLLVGGNNLVPAGERVEVKGVLSNTGSSSALRVQSIVNDYGACGSPSGLAKVAAEPATSTALPPAGK